MEYQYSHVLTLALPAALEEEVLDHLQACPEWVTGFSIAPAEGFGNGMSLPSTLEQVRGRARRRLITILMAQANIEPLLASLHAEFRSPEMAYWITPLIKFGRFA